LMTFYALHPTFVLRCGDVLLTFTLCNYNLWSTSSTFLLTPREGRWFFSREAGKTKSMSCRRAARMAARQIGGTLGCSLDVLWMFSGCSRRSARMATRQIGAQLGCSCQSIFSECRDRGVLSSPGRAGVYEWNTHSRPAKLATNLTPLPALRCVRSCFASPSCFAMSKN